MATEERPTAKQLAYLRRLAHESGTSFGWPQNKREASRAIERLRQRPPSPYFECFGDREAVSRGLKDDVPASSVRGDEVAGYGAWARWRTGNAR